MSVEIQFPEISLYENTHRFYVDASKQAPTRRAVRQVRTIEMIFRLTIQTITFNPKLVLIFHLLLLATPLAISRNNFCVMYLLRLI